MLMYQQYPAFQQFNYSHDFVATSYDAYWDGSWRSSHSGSNYQIYKASNQLQFKYNTGVAAGTAMSLLTAGYMDNAGNLIWNKKITISAPVATQGLDLATADSYANLRGTVDKHLHLGLYTSISRGASFIKV